jgi:four helix bundle protein
MAKRFEDLEVWKEARMLTKSIYGASASAAWRIDRGLQDQIRRSTVSVMANIAEGFERGSNTEFIQFLYVAKSSLAETRSHLYAAFDQGYISKTFFEEGLEATKRLSGRLGKFILYLQSARKKGIKTG